MKRLLVIAAVLAASTALCATSEAGIRFSFGTGNGYYGGHGGHYHGGYNYPRYSYHGYNYAPYQHRTYHDTSHWDYYPGRFVPHGNHYDYIPGHYDYHQTGHWDTHYHH